MPLIVMLLLVFAFVQLVIEIVKGVIVLAMASLTAMVLAQCYRFLLMRRLKRSVHAARHRTSEIIGMLRPYCTDSWRVAERPEVRQMLVANRHAATERISKLKSNHDELLDMAPQCEAAIALATWAAGIAIVLAPGTALGCLGFYGAFRLATALTAR